MSCLKDARRLETLMNSTIYRVTQLLLSKKRTTPAGQPNVVVYSIIMIGFYLTFARKETVYNRHIGHFSSCSVGLLKMSIEATGDHLLLFKDDSLPGACEDFYTCGIPATPTGSRLLLQL